MDIEANEITINVSSKTNDITLSEPISQITVVSSGRGLKGDKGDTGGINYDHSLMDNLDYHSSGHTGFEPSLPVTPADPTYKFLNGNKEWTPISVGGSGYAGDLYFTTGLSDIPGYFDLSYVPEAAETILTGVVQNNEVLFRTYLYTDPIDTTIIDSGTWSFVPWLRVSNATGVTQVKSEPFVRHIDGSETTLFSTYSDEINNTGFLRLKHESIQPSFTVQATDRLGIRIYGKTTSGAAITIYSIVGDGRSSYFTTPLRIRHNQLRDFNGDPEVQHMTSIEKTRIDNLGYSTNESNTGSTWIDGSVIYKKTINLGALPNNTTKLVAHGISNLSTVVKLEGWATDGAGVYITVPTCFYNTAAAFNTDLAVAGANIRLRNAGNLSNYSGYATVFYTKTA